MGWYKPTISHLLKSVARAHIEAEDDLLEIPDGRKVCLWSLSALLPFLSAVQRKHDEPDDWLSDADYIQCPDSNVEVLWVIKKIPV